MSVLAEDSFGMKKKVFFFSFFSFSFFTNLHNLFANGGAYIYSPRTVFINISRIDCCSKIAWCGVKSDY